MKKYILPSLLVCSLAATLALFFLTNPREAPIGFLVAPVVLVFLIISLATFLILKWLDLVRSSSKKRQTVAGICGGVVAMAVVVQSTGGISLGDVLLAALIAATGAVYIAKY